jgi:hypothetical protein
MRSSTRGFEAEDDDEHDDKAGRGCGYSARHNLRKSVVPTLDFALKEGLV